MRRTWSSEVSSEEAEERWLPCSRSRRRKPPTVQTGFTYEISVGQQAVTIPETSLKGRWRELVDRARDGEEARRA